MGVKDFFKMIEGKPCTLSNIANSKIAIDAMNEIYRHSLGIKIELTDESGRVTSHIGGIMANIRDFRKHNIDITYVFDSKEPHELKQETLNRRKEIRTMYDYRTVTGNMIDDTIQLLTLLGVKYIVAPVHIDAEHVCAWLNKTNQVDYVISSDADVFLYGGQKLLKWKDRKLSLYTRDDLINVLKIQDQDIVKIGVMMGTDFCDKTPRIGPKTIIKKFKTVELTESQNKALELFMQDISESTIHVITNDMDVDKLMEWLSSLGFNLERMKKKI